MRLSDEKITDIKEYLNRSIKVTASSLIPQLSKYGIDLIDTIEALQQEIEQLKDENASLRNWNACEEELHNELLESDKRRWELELELEDANNYRAGLEAIVDKLRAQVARMREAIIAWDRVNWCDCDRCKNMRDALAAIDKAIGGKEDA